MLDRPIVSRFVSILGWGVVAAAGLMIYRRADYYSLASALGWALCFVGYGRLWQVMFRLRPDAPAGEDR